MKLLNIHLIDILITKKNLHYLSIHPNIVAMNVQSVRSYAAANPRQAQWLITFLLTATGFACFFLGLFVIGTGWYEAQWPLWATFAGLGVLAYFQYIWKDKAPNRRAWTVFHLSVVLLFGSLNVHLGSRFPVKYGGEVVETMLESASASTTSAITSELAPDGEKEKAGWLKSVIRKGKKSVEELPVWAKILLTILVIAGILAVGYVVGILACALACNEMGVLAALVLIAGWGGVLVGGFFLIRRIFRGKNTDGVS